MLKHIKIAVAVAATAFSATIAHADGGMWIPSLIGRNIADMQSKGFKLTADDIYSVNNASLKDAVVIFGGGCTAEIVSDDGLIFTNHHCGYSQIQSHSTLEHDYLTDGFWAMSRNEELPNEGLSVSMLVRIADVTDSVLAPIDGVAAEAAISQNIRAVRNAASCNGQYETEVKPIYAGNQYILYVYEVYRDVRLVGAPPSSIGKFGGDTDNWVWPRHTGDFSIFRIYANKDNKPASYSPDNVPYKPRRHLKINIGGVKEGDFTMVIGYPGTTTLYAPASYVEMLQKRVYPKFIELRDAKLDVMDRYSKADALTRIQYASKMASTANAWKKWKGVVIGLDRFGIVDAKRNSENELRSAMGGCPELDVYDSIYAAGSAYDKYELARGYIGEIMRGGVELTTAAGMVASRLAKESDDAVLEAVDILKSNFYKDYNPKLAKEMATAVLEVFVKYMPDEFVPATIKSRKGSVADFVNSLFDKSIFSNVDNITAMVEKGKLMQLRSKMLDDKATALFDECVEIYRHTLPASLEATGVDVAEVNKTYMSRLMKAYPDSVFRPDANLTMRVAYGNVAGYEARDAVSYLPFTTLDGIIAKGNMGVYDYVVPERLAELYRTADYGRFADADGKMHVCFAATNHTTGGNSGSPVLNANGELIGLNFDRAWDGIMSDLVFSPELSRNITLDIRYLLFVVDKYAGAGYLIDELDMVDANGNSVTR